MQMDFDIAIMMTWLLTRLSGSGLQSRCRGWVMLSDNEPAMLLLVFILRTAGCRPSNQPSLKHAMASFGASGRSIFSRGDDLPSHSDAHSTDPLNLASYYCESNTLTF
jgi:hypothetical protein